MKCPLAGLVPGMLFLLIGCGDPGTFPEMDYSPDPFSSSPADSQPPSGFATYILNDGSTVTIDFAEQAYVN